VRFTAFIILFLWTIKSGAQLTEPPIGLWREHLPYGSAMDVTAGDGKIYAATPYSLFVVDEVNNSIERLSRVTGLNETGISCIRYDERMKNYSLLTATAISISFIAMIFIMCPM
jgi:hypothetical protein